MRIAIIMALASPWSREIALRLTRLGHLVHVIDFAKNDPRGQYLHASDPFQSQEIREFREQLAGTHMIRSKFSSGLRYFTSVDALKRILRECQADVLLTLYGGGYATMAYLSGFRPYAVYAVGSDIMLVRGAGRVLSRLALEAAQLVFVNGRYLSEKARELAPSASIMPLYIGVDCEKFAAGNRAAEPIRILCSRGFLPVYNNEYLIQGIAGLPDDVPDFVVTFVSSGPTLEETKALADRILSPAMRQRVHFLGGVTSEILLEELKHSHIYVSLSRSDGTSTATLEALASGLCPILSDIPQNREWIDDQAQNGLLVLLDRPEVLTRVLERALKDESLRNRASEYNRKLVQERASVSKNMTELVAQLESLVSRQHGKVL